MNIFNLQIGLKYLLRYLPIEMIKQVPSTLNLHKCSWHLSIGIFLSMKSCVERLIL